MSERCGHEHADEGAAPTTEQALALWKRLTDEQRLDLIGRCCRGCGSLDTGCRCWDDS